MIQQDSGPGAAVARRTWARAVLFALLVVAAASSAPRAVSAASTITVRVSIKVILNPAGHTRPPEDDAGDPVTDSKMLGSFDVANDSLLATFWRGYRFQVTEIVNIGSCASGCDSSDPSFWYSTNIKDAAKARFEHWAEITPAFLWRTNAINLYVSEGLTNGANSSFPPPGPPPNDVVNVGGKVFDVAYRRIWAASTLHHELGHYFSLAHPNGTLEDCCNPSTCITDGDEIEDTLPDGPCFTLDQLSTHRYGLPFASVSAARQDSLLNGFWNNMCYLHPDQKDDPGEGFGQTFLYRMTELQLDQWTDTANGARAGVCSARTRFVESLPPCGGCGTGSSTSPYHTVADALVVSGAGDIVLLRPGSYTGPTTISQPVTLRATRRGTVSISN